MLRRKDRAGLQAGLSSVPYGFASAQGASNAPFVRGNMQGRGLLASEYWPYLYSIIHERNPHQKTSRKICAREPVTIAICNQRTFR